MKLLLDEQISGKVGERLRKQGVDALAVAEETALRGLSDPDVFEIAQAQKRAVVTYNRDDFERVVRECSELGREHHGLVVVHPVRFPGRDFAPLAQALKQLVDEKTLGRSFVVWLQAAARQ